MTPLDECGLDGGRTARGDDILPYPTDETVGAVIVPAPPLLPSMPEAAAVRYLMRLYVGWARARFNSHGNPMARGSTGRIVAHAAAIMRSRGIRPALWLTATEPAWRALREAGGEREALHPAPGWTYSPTRLSFYRPPAAEVLPTRQGHPAVNELLRWRGEAAAELSRGVTPEREAELRAEYTRRTAQARSAVEGLNAVLSRLARDGDWVWA